MGAVAERRKQFLTPGARKMLSHQDIVRDSTGARPLASSTGTKHDALGGMRHMELQTGQLMSEPTTATDQSKEGLPHVDLGMSIGIAAVITIVSAILVAGSTWEVVKGALSAGMTRLLAVIALLSLVAMVYGLTELALAIIATTAERRRKAREV